MRIYDPKNIYTPDEVRQALTANVRDWDFRFERLSSGNVLLGDLEHVTDGVVENNALADIKRTMKFSIRDDSGVNFNSDRIKPYARLKMDALNEPDITTVANAELTLGTTSAFTVTPAVGYEGGVGIVRNAGATHAQMYSSATFGRTALASDGSSAIYSAMVKLPAAAPSPSIIGFVIGATSTTAGYQVMIDNRNGTTSSGGLQIRENQSTTGAVGVTVPGGVVDKWLYLTAQWTPTSIIASLYAEDRVTLLATVTMTDSTIVSGAFGPYGYNGGIVDSLQYTVTPPTRPGYVEWPLGVFLLSSPSRSYRAGALVLRDVQAYDQLLVLRDDRVSDRYTVNAGTNYVTAINTLVAGMGFTLNLTPTTKTLPVARDWDPGTTRLEILNELLGAINYESAFFDEDGVLIGRPYISPADRASEYTYAANGDSLLAGDILQTLDLFAIPNKWTIVVSNADQVPIVSTYTNNSVTSPTSVPNRGRIIADFRTEQDAADQATLDAMVARLAFEASQVYEYVEFDTPLMPVHQNADVYSLDIDGLDINASYSEHTWSLPLQAGSTMSHKVRRVVTVAN